MRGVVRWVVVGAVLAVAAGGCADADPGDAGSPAASASAEAPTGGPVDQFWQRVQALRAEESRTGTTRTEQLVAECMADQGFEYTPVPVLAGSGGVEPGTDFETVEFAHQWGYGIALDPLGSYTSPDAAADPNAAYVKGLSGSGRAEYYAALWGTVDGAEDLSLEEVAELAPPEWEDRGCHGQAEHEVGEGFDAWALYEEVGEMEASVLRDPRLLAAHAEWSACMADAGHAGFATVPEARASIQAQMDTLWQQTWDGLPAGTTAGLDVDEISVLVFREVSPQLADEEIALAVADHTCRDSTGWVQAQEGVSLEYQTEFYAAHEAEFDALWASMEEQQAGR